KSCIFRINRDVRFSNDKSPYKTNMGAFMVRGGKQNGDKYAGYYFHIEPGKSMLAGGAYIPPSQWLTAIREKIDDDPGRLVGIINDTGFKKYFKQIEGEKLKKAPKGFSPEHKHIELLKFKSYLAVKETSDKEVIGDEYLKYAVSVFKAMKPLNDFLNEY
ncbi:MAG TPA: TIGR02453 family protein, partial [Bacteroidales bacterium]|nr:TIGR02453 family protein [Bacteroidales bacterium]